MKTLPAGLQAHLDGGATTMCRCWKLTRRDGAVLGFTDHDEDLAFAGVSFEAASGFAASEISSSAGLAVDNLDVEGALQSAALNEADLSAGLFDDAGIEIYAVNWQDTGQRVLLRRGNLGEISRGRSAFSAEVRGLAHRLNQPFGRSFQYACDADLGDARCGVDLETAAFKASGEVVGVDDDARFSVSGLDGFEAQWFQRGKLTWVSGANDGRSMEVKSQAPSAGAIVLELWLPMSEPVQAGDRFDIGAGCDKQPGTCRGKFANIEFYRGFPFIPGSDFVISYPNRGDPANDGGSRSDG